MRTEHGHGDYQLVSVSTVLILSAFLIGMAVGNVIGTDFEPYVLASGFAGMLSFIGLELAAFRRKLAAIEEGKRYVEDRLDRHILSQSSSGFTLPPATSNTDSQSDASVA